LPQRSEPLTLQVVLLQGVRSQLWLQVVQALLQAAQSLLSISNVLLHMMSIEGVGHFVMMLLQMVREDVLNLSVIYTIILVSFSHMIYVASGLINTGLERP
jgi:hypothetical protein